VRLNASTSPGVDPAVPAELVVLVALFLLRRCNRLRKGQRQRVSVVGRRLAALSVSRLSIPAAAGCSVDVVTGGNPCHNALSETVDLCAYLDLVVIYLDR